LRDLALVCGFSGKFDEALHYFSTALEESRQLRKYTPREEGVTLGFQGAILVRKGELDKAIEVLSRSLVIKQDIHDTSYLLDTVNWLGNANEITKNWVTAEKFYQHNLSEYKWIGHLYFACGAHVGLVRVKHAQKDYAAILPHLAEAEQLVQQYEYNDHLASLRLTQGHVDWEINKKGDTLSFYKHAMIYALRYNRFLLDELLSGRLQGTPLHPIIPYCLEHGEDGRNILIALCDWWKTGVNDIGIPRPDTISPIPEGILLLDAEKIARERELGDGSKQKSVVEQIETAL